MVTVLLVIASIGLVAMLAVIGFVYLKERACRQQVAKRHIVRQEQRLAEARMQSVMQDTVGRMFDAVRRQQ